MDRWIVFVQVVDLCFASKEARYKRGVGDCVAWLWWKLGRASIVDLSPSAPCPLGLGCSEGPSGPLACHTRRCVVVASSLDLFRHWKASDDAPTGFLVRVGRWAPMDVDCFRRFHPLSSMWWWSCYEERRPTIRRTRHSTVAPWNHFTGWSSHACPSSTEREGSRGTKTGFE